MSLIERQARLRRLGTPPIYAEVSGKPSKGQIAQFVDDHTLKGIDAIGGGGGGGSDGGGGEQGPPGPPGPAGPAGAAGAQGPAGATGAQGPTGDAGPQGATGPQGIQGPPGGTGATGPQGPKGDTGATGAQGPAGNTGPQGATGATGPAGVVSATAPLTYNSGTQNISIDLSAYQKIQPIGQCYLGKSGSNLLLSPKDGNQIMINGALVAIPDAGVTLAPTGNAANTFYYTYAYLSSGTLTLEYSTTGYAVQAGTGVKIKSGDATRTLVGLAVSAAAGNWSTVATDVASYFNPTNKTAHATYTSASTTSTTLVAFGNPIRWCSFADREVTARMYGYAGTTVNGSVANLDLLIDLSYPVFTSLQGAVLAFEPATAANNLTTVFNEAAAAFPDSVAHSMKGEWLITSGTLTFNGGWSITILG